MTFEGEITNEYTTDQMVTFAADVIDRAGNVVWTQTAATQTLAAGKTAVLTVSAPLTSCASSWAARLPLCLHCPAPTSKWAAPSSTS